MKALIFVILSIFFSPLLVFSQNQQSVPAKFKGVVVDPYIARIPKASVVIESKGKKWNYETNEDGKTVGEFNVELPAGKYQFTIEARGFKRLVITDFCITSGATIAYEFKMEVRDCDDCYPIAPNK